MKQENSFYYQKIIPNSVIFEIEQMIKQGNTYKQIKDKTSVSIGTIAKVKQGKIKSNREIKNNNFVPYMEYEKILNELNKLKKIIDLKDNELKDYEQQINFLKIQNDSYLEQIEEYRQKSRSIKLDNQITNNNSDSILNTLDIFGQSKK